MMGLPRSVADALDAVTYSRRALAFLQVNAELKLVGAGGNLENYGLGAVHLGGRAADQVSLLEGLLPLPETPFFMPSIEVRAGRAADVHFYGDGDCVWVVLLDVTAERDQAQRTQQRAYDMTLLQEKEALLNRRLEAANAALRTSQLELETSRAALMRAHEQLHSDLAEAAGYLRSQLPAPISQPFAVDWRFVPSMALGGDALGYHLGRSGSLRALSARRVRPRHRSVADVSCGSAPVAGGLVTRCRFPRSPPGARCVERSISDERRQRSVLHAVVRGLPSDDTAT
jgi:hypothetical protein